MAVRVYRTAKWIPDEAPVVRETLLDNGMKQLTVVEPPEKEIQCFHWEWGKPPKKDDTWIYRSIAVASLSGGTAVLLLPIIPLISAIVILASLAWLGFVGYANR